MTNGTQKFSSFPNNRSPFEINSATAATYKNIPNELANAYKNNFEFFITAGLGLEPRYWASKAHVLPLDDPAKNFLA